MKAPFTLLRGRLCRCFGPIERFFIVFARIRCGWIPISSFILNLFMIAVLFIDALLIIVILVIAGSCLQHWKQIAGPKAVFFVFLVLWFFYVFLIVVIGSIGIRSLRAGR